MISYKQSEAKEEAVKLAYELTGNKDDVWLDINKEDKSVAAMKEAVRESETFLCILTPSYFSFFRLQFTWIGTFVLNIVLTLMEWIWLAPKGSGKVREMLRQAQLGLVAGGQMGTFTPMYMVYARKPEAGKAKKKK